MKRYLKKNQLKLKIIDLSNNIIPKVMAEENIGQEFRVKEIDKIRNYFIKEIKQNESISKKHKKIFNILNYIEHLLILSCSFTGYVPMSAFVSLVGIPLDVSSSVITIRTSIVTAGIKNYKSMIQKKT